MTPFPLDAYLDRIGFDGTPAADLDSVAQLMRAQLLTVPFENLDIQAGKLISLTPQVLIDKIIQQRRGGYCFEVNSLFALVLDALAVPYFFIAATPLGHHGSRKPKTHMALVVEFQGRQWLCDCGYGAYGLCAPLALDSAETQTMQDGDLFRLHRNEPEELILQTWVHDVWESQYSFDLVPQKLSDFADANKYNATHHDSLFVRRLLVVLFTQSGRKILFGNILRLIEEGYEEKIHLTHDNRAALLLTHFGLVEQPM